MVKLFGIPNCDSVKKSQKWLTANKIEFEFHDYKKLGITKKQLSDWCEEVGYETLLNKRSRTWKELSAKELSEKDRSNISQTKAISLMQKNPTLIKRPVAQKGKIITVGFDSKVFTQNFK